MAPTVLFFGASRGCGYYAALKLISNGATCTFLLRKPSALTESAEFLALDAALRDETKVRIVEGDATKKEDVEKAFRAAGLLDTIVFSVGGAPVYKPPLSMALDNPLICQTAMSAVLHVLAESPSRSSVKLIAVSSNGLSKTTHAALPFPLKVMHARFLGQPHADKSAMQMLVFHCAQEPIASDAEPPFPTADISELTKDLESGWLVNPVLVQPALLTSGVAKGILNVRSGKMLKGAWSISRRDVGVYIAKEAENREYEGGTIVLAY